MGRGGDHPPHRAVERPARRRARDERLVREAFEGARAARRRADPRRAAPGGPRRACARRASTRSTPTRRQALRAAWEARRSSPPAPRRGKSLCFNLPDARRAAAATPRARALYLYPTKALAQDQARALQRVRAAKRAAPGDLRRRHAARGARGDPPAGEPRPHQPRHAARRDPAQPRARGATSSPTSRSSWSTRRTSTAACSARTSPTCCAGCGGSPAPTAPTPRFLLASATIANPVELAERLTGLDDVAARSTRDGSPGAGAQIAMWNPPVIDEALAARRSRARRGGRPARRARPRGRADDLLHEVAQGASS